MNTDKILKILEIRVQILSWSYLESSKLKVERIYLVDDHYLQLVSLRRRFASKRVTVLHMPHRCVLRLLSFTWI